MKKMLLIAVISSIIVAGVLAEAGVASAHRWNFGFGVYVPPPVIAAPPPVYSYPPPYYAPRGYYYPRPYVGYRSWMPGFWDWRQTLYGWESVWMPGHWEYR